MSPEAVGTLLGALIGTLVATIIGAVAVVPKVLKGFNLQVKNSEEVERNNKEIGDLRKTVNALGDANEKLRAENTASNTKIEALETDQKQKAAIIEQVRVQLNKADDRQREGEKTVAEMQGRLAEQREAADRQQQRLEQLILNNAEERQRSTKLEGDLKSEHEKNATLIVKIDAIQAELNQAKKDLSEETTRRISLEVLVTSLQAEVKHLKDIPAPVSAVVVPKVETVKPSQENI